MDASLCVEKSLHVRHEQLGRPLANAYGDALIYVRCRLEVGILQREKAIPALFEFLQDLGNGFEGDAKPKGDLEQIVRSVGVSRGDFGPGPFFQVEAVKAIGDPTADSIRAKWIKDYKTDHPIELLAYYHWHPTMPEFFWIRLVEGFVGSNWGSSPFRKVWICDPGSRRILFVASNTLDVTGAY